MSLYRKIRIYYFSGTGNSRRIALWIRGFAVSEDVECEILDIANANLEKTKILDSDVLIIFISPIHGFNYPQITIDFVRHFPKGANRVVLMNTRAGLKLGNYVTPGLTGVAFILSSIILKSKGYKIVGQIPFDMPSNWMSIHPALTKRAVKFLHEKNYYRVKEYCTRIFKGETVFRAYRDIVQDVLISPISLAYYIMGRFVLAKSFYASIDCDSCGLCSKRCPVQAIEMIDNRPFWKLKCESCMKCMSDCPQKSIDTAYFLFVFVGIVCSIVGSYFIRELLFADVQSGGVSFTIKNILFFILLCFFYKVQHFLLKYKFVKKIISSLSPTHYKFWGRYKSIKDSEWKI